MFKIDCNKMTVTRGDKAYIAFRLANSKLEEGDAVVMIVKTADDILFTKEANDINDFGVASIDLESEDTNQEEGSYTYAIRVKMANGREEVVSKGEFIIESM